ncbi:oligosaccharyltransferase complex subunit delta (ribophorin II) [Sporothrix brasiliensis 5110]|uniref:Oligosaccharyltransferase complex subunit delta (Ribophorin II) n=1 Tax=Sporothrix brasiliensis 5110 TaxID=1398154 RepID=A0A0C2IT52_9PEZI|nr:oligosaccharyltransferase complex subunit delta (ribophorin II) [Sporothrix brasiliensis 5110]KIH90040.1 oligosaccharyltransferase complex subunit delta (ribophorin II) [Sporothrix brasiliensis 5110]
MRFAVSSLLLAAVGVAQAASAWSFDDGSITISSKGSSNKVTEKLNAKASLDKALVLGSNDVAKITLTTKDNGKEKRPHQAFLLLQDPASGLEAPFPLAVKESGKGSVQISHKDIPVQLLASGNPIHAHLVIGSFGSAQAYVSSQAGGGLFALTLQHDPNAAAPSSPAPERFSKKGEIHHIFRADPRSPPKIISLLFVLAVAATVPVLFGAWLLLGANLAHLSKALSAAPLSHAAFFGSILAMEGVFFLYYTSWNLFQMLPVAGIVGAVAVLSGTKALGEVQARRLAGER